MQIVQMVTPEWYLCDWGAREGNLSYFLPYLPVPFEIISVYESLIVYYKINFKIILMCLFWIKKYLDLKNFPPDFILSDLELHPQGT